MEMLVPATPNCTVANAMCPSRDICPGVVYGSLTEVTCAARSNGTRALVICALTAGEVIGAVEATASVSVSPEARGKCWLSTVWPGSLLLKVFSAAAPNCIHNTMRQATPMIQVNSVIQRCR